jgi:hypothetical protein
MSWPVLAATAALLGWNYDARLIRSVTLSLRNREFTRQAVFAGMSVPQILLRQHLPYVMPVIFFTAMNNLIWAIGLEVTLSVSLSEAVEGSKVDLPTPWGTISLRIPPMTSGGRKLRAAGMGVRHANGAKGDLIAEVQIVLPINTLAPDVAKNLLTAAKAAEEGAPPPRPGLTW